MRNSSLLTTSQVYEFGVFRLDADGDGLYVTAETVKLAPKVLQCLILLVESNGKTITRDEFFEKVWTDTFVEDNALSYTISQLRKTLAEFDKETKYIETVARRGFRFAAEIKKIAPQKTDEIILQRHSVEEVWLEESIETESPKTSADPPPFAPVRRISRLWLVSAILLLVVTAGGFLGYQNWNAKTSVSAIKSIAVLPLKSFDANSEDGELRLRITDALITKLGSLNEISVRPTNSILSFAQGETDILEAGRKLEVDAVLDGRIQIEGERLRVTLQLVSVRTSEQIWSGQFDGKTNEILNLQDKISAQLLPRLTPTATLAKNPTANSEAYENYLKGRYLWNKRTNPEMKQAAKYFEQAIALDPNFALAYAGLADTYSQLTNHSALPRFEGYAKAKETANKALAIDPNLSEAYSALGWILHWHEWNWAEAEQAFARSIELNPNNAEAHHWRGLNFLAVGKMEEYYASVEVARKLAPLTKPIAQNYYGVVLKRDGCEKAIEYFQKFFDLFQISDAGRTEMSGAHYAACGEFNKAIPMLEKMPFESLGSRAQVSLGVAYAKTGRRQKAVETLEWFRKRNSTVRFYLMPYIHTALGDFDAAFTDLEKGIEARDDRFTKLKADEFLTPLNSDARFKQLLKKMNLPD